MAAVPATSFPDSVSLAARSAASIPTCAKKMIEGITRTANAEAAMAGAPPPDLKIVEGGKAVVNDQALTDRTAPVFKAAFGDHAILMPAPSTMRAKTIRNSSSPACRRSFSRSESTIPNGSRPPMPGVHRCRQPLAAIRAGAGTHDPHRRGSDDTCCDECDDALGRARRRCDEFSCSVTKAHALRR